MLGNDLLVYGDQDVKVPAHLNFGKYILDRIRTKTDEIALENWETQQSLTYREFTLYAINMAMNLAKLGVGRGDIVAIGSEKRIEFIPATLAVVFTGAAFTSYDVESGGAGLKHKLSMVKPNYFICSKQFWVRYKVILTKFDSIKKFITFDDDVDPMLLPIKTLFENVKDLNWFEPVQVQGQIDTACILYSSGTTGMSKAVQWTHLNCILNSLTDDIRDESLQTAFLTGLWHHNYDKFMTFKFLALRRKIVYVQEPRPATILKCLDSCDVDIAFSVPSILGLISKTEEEKPFNLNSLKVIYSRSAPLHFKTIQEVKRKFPKVKLIKQGYGMTEAGEVSSESWGTKGLKHGSVGMASPGFILKIVDPKTHKILGPNQHGEICLKGPVFMKGYIEVDPATYLDEQGFYKTGDLGYYDEDKYFYIVGRLKEMFTYDGYEVPPLELETILELHPGVREAGVVGKPVPYHGEEPTAFVVKQPGINVDGN